MSIVANAVGGTTKTMTNVDCVLWAIGRDANTTDLELGVAVSYVDKCYLTSLFKGVGTEKSGFISVDPYQTTSVSNIYAIGDVAGKKLLTPGLLIYVLNLKAECLTETI